MTDDLAARICRSGRELHRQGLIAGVAGNLSVRLDGGRILITRAGTHKGRLEPHDLVVVGAEPQDTDGDASSELPLHRACYATVTAIGAVVHSHAPALTAAGLNDLVVPEHLPELELATGGWRFVAPLPSGSTALGEAVAEALQRPTRGKPTPGAPGDSPDQGVGVLLLRNHGAVTVGPSLEVALHRMELAELAAYTLLLARDGIAPGVLDRLDDLVSQLSGS